VDNKLPCDSPTLRQWMISYIESVLSPAGGVPTDKNFDTYGFDSVEAVVMAGVMEEEFAVPVDPMWLLENPNIDAFVAAHANDTPLAAASDPERG
jgi:acyl carrier protein